MAKSMNPGQEGDHVGFHETERGQSLSSPSFAVPQRHTAVLTARDEVRDELSAKPEVIRRAAGNQYREVGLWEVIAIASG